MLGQCARTAFQIARGRLIGLLQAVQAFAFTAESAGVEHFICGCHCVRRSAVRHPVARVRQ